MLMWFLAEKVDTSQYVKCEAYRPAAGPIPLNQVVHHISFYWSFFCHSNSETSRPEPPGSFCFKECAEPERRSSVTLQCLKWRSCCRVK